MELKFISRVNRVLKTVELKDGPNVLGEPERWYIITMPEVSARVKASRPSLAKWWFKIMLFGGPGARAGRYLRVKEEGEQ